MVGVLETLSQKLDTSGASEATATPMGHLMRCLLTRHRRLYSSLFPFRLECNLYFAVKMSSGMY